MTRRILLVLALVAGAALATLVASQPSFAAGLECPLGFQKVSNGAQDLCIQVCPLGQEIGPNGQCGPIVCKIKGQIYDAATGQCGCPPGKILSGSPEKGGCVKLCPPGQATGPDGKCTSAAMTCPMKGQVYDASLNTCVCAPGTIFRAGKEGSQCVNPCPTGQKLNANYVCSAAGGGAASAPMPATTTSAFNGVWITRTSQGGDFVITLSVDPNGGVIGTFVEKNPKYNGGLQGQLDKAGTGFDFTYRETVTGFTGRGAFKVSADGKSLTGSVIDDSDPKTVYTWSGTKQQ